MSVVVLGMHRSGTSAIAGSLRFVGLHLPDERYLLPPQPDNPRGFFENRVLLDLNDQLLEALGGDWSAPPPLPPGWQDDPSLDGLRAEAEQAFRETMPPRGWIWKDPRTCLTLPFWLPMFDEPPVAVFIYRDPRRIARSLESRNGFQPALGSALWEWYTHSALSNMGGLPVTTVRFEDLLEGPVVSLRRIGEFLRANDAPVTDPDENGIRDFLAAPSEGEKLGEGPSTPDLPLTGEQEALLRTVASLEQQYTSFPELELPPMTPSSPILFDERRRHLQERQQQLEVNQRLAGELKAAKEERLQLRQEHQRFRRQLHRERRELMDLRRRHAALRTRYEQQLRSRPTWIRASGDAYRRYKLRTKRAVANRYRGRRTRRR